MGSFDPGASAVDADRLAEIAEEFRHRVRDEADPEENARWLLSVCPDPTDWFRLNFVYAAATPTTDWLRLTQWTRPLGDPNHVDEIAVERACHGDKVPLNRAEQRAAVHKLRKRGMTGAAIGQLLGLSERTVQRELGRRRVA